MRKTHLNFTSESVPSQKGGREGKKCLSAVQRARLQCCGKTPRARSDSEMRDSIFLSFSLRRQSKGRRPAAPPASASAENQNLHLSSILPRLHLLLPAVPLSVAIAKIYIRIFGPRDRVHCLEVVIRRARACEHNTGSLVLNRIDLYRLMMILISGVQYYICRFPPRN